MRPRFTFNEAACVVRTTRNDDTYAGLSSGTLLVRRGSISHIRDRRVFLQDQIIYQIHSSDCDRVIDCRKQELIAGDQSRLAGNLQYGDSVICQMASTMQDKMAVSVGQSRRIEATGQGEHGDGYTVDFGGCWFRVPVSVLAPVGEGE